jgi:hypothetical protein
MQLDWETQNLELQQKEELLQNKRLLDEQAFRLQRNTFNKKKMKGLQMLK